MGLDVYVYRYGGSPAAIEKKEKKYEDATDAILDRIKEKHGVTGSMQSLPKGSKVAAAVWAEYDRETAKLARKLGLRTKNKYAPGKYGKGAFYKGESPLRERLELDSKRHPKHMFKVGYFRSSYNGGGTNSVLSRYGIADLYEIFKPGDRYSFVPDWKRARAVAAEAADKLRKVLAETGGASVVKVPDRVVIDSAATEADALKAYAAELARFKSGKAAFGSYHSRAGEFHMSDPLKVRAIVPAKGGGAFLVLDGDDGGDNWYLQALEVVVETCDHVLATKRPQSFGLHWSG